jgi:hypothetical protein
MQCSDLLIVGKKTVNIGILVDCGGGRNSCYVESRTRGVVANVGKDALSEDTRQIDVIGQMIGPSIKFILQSSGDRLRDMKVERRKSLPHTSAIEPGATKGRLVK